MLDVGCGPDPSTTEPVRRLGRLPSVPSIPRSPSSPPPRSDTPGSRCDSPPRNGSPSRIRRSTPAWRSSSFTSWRPGRRAPRRAAVHAARGASSQRACGTMRAATDPSACSGGRRRTRRHVHDESGSAGAREGHLAELFSDAGLGEIETTTLSVTVRHPSFEEWWEPYTLGVGPAGELRVGTRPCRSSRTPRDLPQLTPGRTVRGDRRRRGQRGLFRAAFRSDPAEDHAPPAEERPAARGF